MIEINKNQQNTMQTAYITPKSVLWDIKNKNPRNREKYPASRSQCTVNRDQSTKVESTDIISKKYSSPKWIQSSGLGIFIFQKATFQKKLYLPKNTAVRSGFNPTLFPNNTAVRSGFK